LDRAALALVEVASFIEHRITRNPRCNNFPISAFEAGRCDHNPSPERGANANSLRLSLQILLVIRA
jgi:hypothetical protein